MKNIIRTASFSRCKLYRYQLTRRWDEGQGSCVFIGLNPSTANAEKDDPTIRRCMGFAHDWGFQSMTMVNLFAYRTPHPDLLKKSTEPVGPVNRRALKRALDSANCIVAAWGVHGDFAQQAHRLRPLFSNYPLYCLGLTKQGQPAHPLYQRRDSTLQTFEI